MSISGTCYPFGQQPRRHTWGRGAHHVVIVDDRPTLSDFNPEPRHATAAELECSACLRIPGEDKQPCAACPDATPAIRRALPTPATVRELARRTGPTPAEWDALFGTTTKEATMHEADHLEADYEDAHGDPTGDLTADDPDRYCPACWADLIGGDPHGPECDALALDVGDPVRVLIVDDEPLRATLRGNTVTVED